MPNLKKEARRKPIERFYCVICGEAISDKRLIQKSVTCSEAHAKILKLERRRLRDLGRCRFCNRPSTPGERALFAAWRKMKPEDLAKFLEWQANEPAKRSPGRPRSLRQKSPNTPLGQELGVLTL